jgi:Ca2+-binding EF-hand superfamily protein
VTFALENDHALDLEETFDIFCLAGSDKLPVEKLGVALRSAGRNPTEAQLRQFIDDRSNPNAAEIEFTEFKDIYERQKDTESSTSRYQMINSIKFALRAFERDGSGLIDRDELKGGTQSSDNSSSSSAL